MPGTRLSSSTTLRVAKLDRNRVVKRLFGEISETTSKMSVERFCTITPLRRTSSGRRGTASCTRLLTLNTALSTLVPGSKVAVMLTAPVEEAEELK